MIRLEGVPVAAERPQTVLGSAVPYHGTTTADASTPEEFQTGVDMDPGAIIQGSSDTPRCLRSQSPE